MDMLMPEMDGRCRQKLREISPDVCVLFIAHIPMSR